MGGFRCECVYNSNEEISFHTQPPTPGMGSARVFAILNRTETETIGTDSIRTYLEGVGVGGGGCECE